MMSRKPQKPRAVFELLHEADRGRMINRPGDVVREGVGLGRCHVVRRERPGNVLGLHSVEGGISCWSAASVGEVDWMGLR